MKRSFVFILLLNQPLLPREEGPSVNYLRFLDKNDYPLSEIELVVIGKHASEGVYLETCG